MPINQNRNNNNKTQIDTNYAHLQPQAVELEKVVLGALMIDTDAFSVDAAVPMRYFYMLPVEAVQIYGLAGKYGAICVELAE